MALPLVMIVFSKDRARPLDLTLRSLMLHANDIAQAPLVVIYRATTEKHARQYDILCRNYKHCQHIKFFLEKNFRRDLLTQLATHAGLGGRLNRYLNRLWLGWRMSRWRQPLLAELPQGYVLFLVDDNIFVGDFSLQDALESLEKDPGALGFSLRLGLNTTYCYTVERRQSLPEFTILSGNIVCYNWTSSELDFAYPLEVSSSIYRIGDLLPWLDRWPFDNPNELETHLAAQVHQFRTRPRLCCYRQSVTFCNPANRVNLEYQNRAGKIFPASSDFLAEKFANGERVDAGAYSGFIPTGCHQEVEFVWRSFSDSSFSEQIPAGQL